MRLLTGRVVSVSVAGLMKVTVSVLSRKRCPVRPRAPVMRRRRRRVSYGARGRWRSKQSRRKESRVRAVVCWFIRASGPACTCRDRPLFAPLPATGVTEGRESAAAVLIESRPRLRPAEMKVPECRTLWLARAPAGPVRRQRLAVFACFQTQRLRPEPVSDQPACRRAESPPRRRMSEAV